MIRIVGLVVLVVQLSACSAPIGSEKWCANLKEKPKAEWTSIEAADYVKHCVL